MAFMLKIRWDIKKDKVADFKSNQMALCSKRCRASTLRDAMKIVPPVVLEEGRQSDGRGVGI